MLLLKLIKKIPFIRKIITFLYPLLFPTIHAIAHQTSKFTSFLYFVLFKMDWGKLPPTEWMDHDQDNFYQFSSNGSFLHLERGILNRLLVSNFFFNTQDYQVLKVKKNLNILDLCSGDSYISQKFFFDCAKNIVSIDLDKSALNRGQLRKKRHKYLNYNHFFFQSDIEKENIKNLLLKNNLKLKFDIVLFNAAIEHFKNEELEFIFSSIKEVMNEKSLIFSYTIVEDQNNPIFLPDHHEMFFNNKEELEKIFKRYFYHTKSFETLVNGRWNIYCAATNYKDKSFL